MSDKETSVDSNYYSKKEIEEIVGKIEALSTEKRQKFERLLDKMLSNGLTVQENKEFDSILELAASKKSDLESVEEEENHRYVPLDKEIYKNLPELFGAKKSYELIEENKKSSGEVEKVYKKKTENKTIKLTFLIPPGIDVKLFSKYKQNVFLFAQLKAYNQKTLTPQIKHKDFVDGLGGKRSIYNILDDALKSLTLGSYEISKEGEGKDSYWNIGHLVDEVERFGKRRGSYYKLRLNPKVSKSIKTFIEIDNSEEEIEQLNYIPYPAKEIKKKIDRKKRLIEYVIGLKCDGKGSYPIQIRTILRKMGLSNQEIKTKSKTYLAHQLDEGLEAVENRLEVEWSLTPESMEILNEKPVDYSFEEIKENGFEETIEKLKEVRANLKEQDMFKKISSRCKIAKSEEFLKLKIGFRKIK